MVRMSCTLLVPPVEDAAPRDRQVVHFFDADPSHLLLGDFGRVGIRYEVALDLQINRGLVRPR